MTVSDIDRHLAIQQMSGDHAGQYVAFIDEEYLEVGVSRIRRKIINSGDDPQSLWEAVRQRPDADQIRIDFADDVSELDPIVDEA